MCVSVADVFMFCCLLLTAFALVIEIWKRMRHTDYFWSRTLLISGALLVSLTGVFPAREARDNSAEQTTLKAGGKIHTAGIGLGVIIMVHVPEYVSAHRRLEGKRHTTAILCSLLPGMIGTDGAELLYTLCLWGLMAWFIGACACAARSQTAGEDLVWWWWWWWWWQQLRITSGRLPRIWGSIRGSNPTPLDEQGHG